MCRQGFMECHCYANVNSWLILLALTKSWPVQTRLSGAFFVYILANVNINELNSLETMPNPLGLDEILRG